MCRLTAYLGNPILLEKILVKPTNSIIMQSLHARESLTHTNGDGFGLGWYAPQISKDPALFTSISPAWNDRNLLNLTAKIESSCFFAHVRAASAGGVSQFNCHPFVNDQWMLMHNGEINNFIQIKRYLRRQLDDDIYNWIQGQTDSEHFFALFLQLAKKKDLNNINTLGEVLINTIRKVEHLVKEKGGTGPSFYNLCLTDGKRLVASRYCTHPKDKPETLYYLTSTQLKNNFPRYKKRKSPEFVLVTSEKLSEFSEQWPEVPVNHLILIDEMAQITFKPII